MRFEMVQSSTSLADPSLSPSVTLTPRKEYLCAVVVTYFPDEKLLDRLQKIQQQVDRVVVVDNGSSGESAESLRTAEQKLHLEVIRNAENLGIATALNQGVRQAQ